MATSATIWTNDHTLSLGRMEGEDEAGGVRPIAAIEDRMWHSHFATQPLFQLASFERSSCGRHSFRHGLLPLQSLAMTFALLDFS